MCENTEHSSIMPSPCIRKWIYIRRENSLIVKFVNTYILNGIIWIEDRTWQINPHSLADKRMSKQSATFCHQAYLDANVRENEVEACTCTLMKNGRLGRFLWDGFVERLKKIVDRKYMNWTTVWVQGSNKHFCLKWGANLYENLFKILTSRKKSWLTALLILKISIWGWGSFLFIKLVGK